jgi:pimeloyl-ACP methyl ester carboxylesterase
MQLELMTFKTSDGVDLDALLYRPDGDTGDLAALLVHGKTMNFYTGPGRILPSYLAEMGVPSLAMNRRGHDLGSIRNGRGAYGGSWETFGDSQLDIAAGLAELRRRGYRRLVLMGHSFGGIAAATYAGDHPEEIVALGLLSAGSGGPEYLVQASRSGMLAGERHEEAAAEARRLVAEERGRQLIAVPGWWYAISAESFLDLGQNVPFAVDGIRRTTCPVLALRGTKEPPAVYPAEAFAEAAGPRATLALVEGADHFYNGVEPALAEAVCSWLRRVVG